MERGFLHLRLLPECLIKMCGKLAKVCSKLTTLPIVLVAELQHKAVDIIDVRRNLVVPHVYGSDEGLAYDIFGMSLLECSVQVDQTGLLVQNRHIEDVELLQLRYAADRGVVENQSLYEEREQFWRIFILSPHFFSYLL